MSNKGFSIGFIMLLGFLLLALIGVFVFTRFQKVKETSSALATPTPLGNVGLPVSSPTVTPIATTFTNENIFTTEAISFAYPKDWQMHKEGLVNGTAYKLMPSTLTSGVGYPKIVVEILDSSDATVMERQKDYVKQGFRQTKATVGSLDTTIYATTAAIKVTANGISTDPVQVSSVHIPSQKAFYSVYFEYEGASANAQMDTFFKDFLSKMTIRGTTNLLN